jgi:hypothetical protein
VFKLAQITKEYNEAAALCSQINLFGFIDDEIFLTKSGDLGIVFSLEGIDHECLDVSTIENLTRRISAAFRIFDEKCRVYQYLFKRNRQNIPHKTYQNPIVNAAIESRMAHLETKAESLYSFRINYVVLYEGFRHKASILQGFGKLTTHPVEAARELRAIPDTSPVISSNPLCRPNRVRYHTPSFASSWSVNTSGIVRTVPANASTIYLLERSTRRSSERISARAKNTNWNTLRLVW